MQGPSWRAHSKEWISAQVEGGQRGEDRHVGAWVSAVEVKAAHVQTHKRSIGCAYLPRE